MRTTLILEDETMITLKELAARQSRTLTEVVTETLNWKSPGLPINWTHVSDNPQSEYSALCSGFLVSPEPRGCILAGNST